MQFLKSIIAGVIGNAVYEFTKTILILIAAPIGLGLLLLLIVFFTSLDKTSLITGFCLSLPTLAIFGYIIYVSVTETKEKADNKSLINADFEILEEEVVYKHITKYKLVYYKRLKALVLKDGLDRFTDKYHWTGNGTVKITLEDSKQELIELKKKEAWQIIEIKFPATCKKGDEITVGQIFELEDTAKESIPILSATITEPTRFLRLKVAFSENVKVDSTMTKKVLNTLAGRKAIEYEECKIEFGEFVWAIDAPEISKCYMLQWDWLE